MRKYDFKKIEKKWQKAWQKEGVYEPKIKGESKRRKFYNLMMFPYLSAEGLHVGNMYASVGSDIYGRLKRMQGLDVFEPIGLDGFGIHSENYALKVGTHPVSQAKVSEKRFYKQLEAIGNGFAWKEHLETYDPEYYRWTQWIFIQMWKAGLAYRKRQAVNWCPKDLTVLADEQVIAGKCERCGSVAVKRELEQWFFRITKYAEKLLKNLDKIDWSEKVKIAQRNWIGKSEGALIKFPIANSPASARASAGRQFPKKSAPPGHSERSEESSVVEVFTTRPDTIYGATYLVLAPEHQEIKNQKSKIKNWAEVEKYIETAKKKSESERIAEGGEKTGVELKGVKAINPATGKEIPIWIADYVVGGYGTGAIMAVPAHDERDFEFAKKFHLPVKQVVQPALENGAAPEAACWTGDGTIINSFDFNGLTAAEAKQAMGKKFGTPKVQYRLRDWLISRQRYWGPPIPMIFCATCASAGKGERKIMPGWYAEKEKNLPVRLPYVKDFRPRGKGKSPLASIRSFYEVKCPGCKSKARRETDVSDTFLDSAWYYLRYPNVNVKSKPWDPAILKKWLPVDMYIGGAEHSVLHLLYSRFLAMALHGLKYLKFEEPFTQFRAHGLIIKDGAKMSKSKGNVINPDEYIARFSADVLRTYLMFLAPFEQGGDFRDEGILGVERFLAAVRRYVEASVKAGFKSRAGLSSQVLRSKTREDKPLPLKKTLHRAVRKVTEDIENLKYNTALSQLMILFNELNDSAASGIYLDGKDTESTLKLVAPFAPYLTEELWRTALGHKKSIHLESWPVWKEEFLKDDTFTLVVQINGKVRASITAEAGLDEKEAKELAVKQPRVCEALGGREPRRIIYVPGRLINIVV